MIGWRQWGVINDETGRIHVVCIWPSTRSEAVSQIVDAMGETWPTLRKRGFRVVQLDIYEVVKASAPPRADG